MRGSALHRWWVGPVLGLLASLALLPLSWTVVLQGFELKTVDARMRLRGAAPVAPEVVVCAVDRRSVARLGQWPWPRSVLAQLVRRLNQAGARTIAFDMIFAEPDRGGIEQDRALEDAFEEAGNIVLGFYLTAEDVGSGEAPTRYPAPVETLVLPPGDFPELSSWSALVTNLPSLTQVAPLAGNFNVIPDSDGTVRHYSLVVRHSTGVYPSLALRAVERFRGGPGISVRPYQGVVPRVRLGGLEVPSNEKGELWVNFRGGFGQTFRYESIVDVLDGKVAPDAFRDRLVFVGATETGLGDVVTTPFDTMAPGVEVHATVADTLLHERYMHDGAPEALFGIMALLFLGPLAGGLATAPRRPLHGAWGVAAVVLLYGVSTQLVFIRAARHLDLVLPVMATAVGYTAAAVWRNVFTEARAREIRRLMGKYVPDPVIQEMLRDPENVRFGGEKRELTVLFADLRGFTSISERLPPEEVVTFLNRFLESMTEIILAHEGTVDKYMGDAIMAFFGAPVAQADHSQRACAAALAMQASLAERNRQLVAESRQPVLAGIGINTGPMSVGNMGSTRIFDYTVIGDHVNLGSRLEGLTRRLGVNIIVSQFTADQVAVDFVFREIDLVRVKGRKVPVRVFELLGASGEKVLTEDFRRQFADGLAAYRARSFDMADKCFRDALRLRPDDGPSKLYLDRLKAFQTSPPHSDWDGVTKMSEK